MRHPLFPFRVTTGAMVGARFDLSVVPSVLRISKAGHDSPSCSQSGGIVGSFGSIPGARRQVATARIIPPGMESTRKVKMALRLSVVGKMYSSNPVVILAMPSCQSVWPSTSSGVPPRLDGFRHKRRMFSSWLRGPRPVGLTSRPLSSSSLWFTGVV